MNPLLPRGLPRFVSCRFPAHKLEIAARIAREGRARIEADPRTTLVDVVSLGTADGWTARMVLSRYTFPAPSLVAWDESPLRTAEDRLYLLNRLLSDVVQRRPHRGGWVVGVYDGGKAA